MMKKKIVAALFALIVSLHSVMAADIQTSNYSAGAYTVSGKADIAKMPVKVEILKKTATILDFDNITEENFFASYLDIRTQSADENGGYEFNIAISGNEKGNYPVRVSFFRGKSITTVFYTYTKEEMEDAFESFIGNDEKTKDDLKTFIRNYYGGLNIEYSEILKLEDKEVLFENIFDVLSGMESTEDLVKALRKEIGVRYISSAGSYNHFKEYEDIFELEETNYYDAWTEFTQTEKEKICLRLKGLATLEKMKDELENQIILEILKKTSWNSMKGQLTYYKNNIGLNLSAVNTLKDAQQKEVYLQFLSDLKSGKVKDIADITKHLNELAKKAVSSGGTSGGSSGGSSGSSSYSPSLIPQQSVLPFKDLGDAQWAGEAIISCYENGIINGKGDKIFDPNGKVTREEFVAMVMRTFRFEDAEVKVSFDDVPQQRWSYEAITKAYANRIIQGMGDGYFGAAENIKRCDMVKIIYAAATKNGAVFDKNAEFAGFADSENVPIYAVEAVDVLSSAGMINGIGGNFLPDNYTTRAEAATLIYRVAKYLKILE